MTISPFRERYKHELRTDILRLAREEFVHEEGYAGSSMRRVAEQVGGVPSAMQALCEQREISDCLVEESFAALMRAPVSVKYLPGEDPINRLKRAMRAYVPFGLVNPDDCRLGFVIQRPENNRPQAPNFASDGLKSRIGKCIAAGYFANGDMDLIAPSLLAPVHGITSRIIQSRSSLSSIMRALFLKSSMPRLPASCGPPSKRGKST